MNTILVDDDDDVEFVYSNVPAPIGSASRLMQISQQIDLLKAFCKSPTPIPLEYSKFYVCAKKVNQSYSDEVILSAWKKAISKQLTNMLFKPPPRASSPSLQVIDLTESSHNSDPNSSLQPTIPLVRSVPSASPSPSITTTNTLQQPPTTTIHQPPTTSPPSLPALPSPLSHPICSREHPIPVALFVNANYDGAELDASICNKMYSSTIPGPVQKINSNSETLENAQQKKTNKAVINDNDYFSNSENNDSEDSGTSSLKSSKQNPKRKETSHLLANLMKNENHDVVESFIGVKAKIRKVMGNSQCSSKPEFSEKRKRMSAAELKQFKLELKQQKIIERRKLANQEMEKVHDRLVDVLIPKYFLKTSQKKN